MNTLQVTFSNPITGKSNDLTAQAKEFSTGSTGFWAGGKIEVNGKRYQVSCNIVEIGSKLEKSLAA